jgi:hypothetical protein
MVYDSLTRGELDGLPDLAGHVVASHLSPLPAAVHGS